MEKAISLTKSDFLLFLEAPRHLWANKHNLIDKTPSEFDVHIMEQGYEVEVLAREYASKHVLKPNESMRVQDTFVDAQFTARTDILIYKPNTDSYDLYEIKSGTSIKKENLFDVTYQFLIITKQIKIDRVFILHLNSKYIREDHLDLYELFIAEDVTHEVYDHLDRVNEWKKIALQTANAPSVENTTACLSPKGCPCPEICFPGLPEVSIFDIPILSAKKKTELLNCGITDIRDVPKNFELSSKQRQIVDVAQACQELINRAAIKKEMDQFKFPLYFLDYETCLSAVPLFNGYKPQQNIVFQYSLHKLDSPNALTQHTEHLTTTMQDPSKSLIKQLQADIGNLGTVFVWNKTFEKTRNKEMAAIHPEYRDFLEALNSRIYDLGDFINLGYYLHPKFKGSWSLKTVLPVMVPELGYDEMQISKGDQAMTAWWKLINGALTDEAVEKTKAMLLEYCKLDTRAMVEIWKVLFQLGNY